MKKLLTTIFLLISFLPLLEAQSTATDLVINIQVATYDNSTVLTWNQMPHVTGYNVLRKARGQKNFTLVASNLPANQTGYMDVMATKGTAYEYCVQSNTNNNVSGYVFAGKEIPAVHQAGEVLLIIDQTYQVPAADEIATFKRDLIKEGWKVAEAYVSRSQSVASVKALVSNAYNNNPTGFKGSILLGHVPVPYSGNIAPDAHTDHIGAWPSDVFYADVNPTQSNVWNDVNIQNQTATDIRNHNIVGDGKYDVSVKASNCCIKLFVGRIDVYNMPIISGDDVALFKQYLNKNHQYRAGVKKFRNNGLVQDNFGYFSGEAFAQNGWRNFNNILGENKVAAGNYMADQALNSYIWSYACGGGTYTSAQGIGTTTNFKTDKIESVFTMLYGSYFGDWDNKNNFLRAPIASPSSTLVSIWGGRPNWFFHTMALGEPIGYSYINSIENSGTYFPRGLYSGQVHQSLHGDPTLKMYMFDAPSSFLANVSEDQETMYLQWQPSTDPDVIGYYLYKANGEDGNFELVSSVLIETTSMELDLQGNYDPNVVYMVKAVKLEQTATGSFYNLSPGRLSSENLNITLPVTLTTFKGQQNNNGSNTLFWQVTMEDHMVDYTLERSEDGIRFEELGQVTAYNNGLAFNDYQWIDETPKERNYYRLKMRDINDKITLSEIVYLSQSLNQSFTIYPTQFSHTLHVQFASQTNAELHLTLLDLRGNMVHQASHTSSIGMQEIPITGLDRLATGMYMLVIHNTETNQKSVHKVLRE